MGLETQYNSNSISVGRWHSMKIRITLIIFIIFAFASFCEKSLEENYDKEVTEFAVPEKGKLPLFYGKDLRPAWEEDNTSRPREILKFSMKDQNATEVSEEFCKGRITVVSFFFTRCSGICPTITNNLGFVQKRFESDGKVQILSFSATPDLDSPPVLKEYAAKRKIRYDKWRLLTGDQKQIYTLARDSFNADTPSPKENSRKKLTESDFLHSDHVYLLDGNLRLRGIYNGKMRSSIEELNSDIEVLQKEM